MVPYAIVSRRHMNTSKELIENAKSLDGRDVTYRGELVTAVLNRKDHSWVNLNDGDNAIGVWCEDSMVRPVKFIGDYKNRGDILEVSWIFHRACPAHGGELDIHAQTVSVVRHGFPQSERIYKTKLDLSIALFLIILSIVIIFRKRF